MGEEARRGINTHPLGSQHRKLWTTTQHRGVLTPRVEDFKVYYSENEVAPFKGQGE